MVPRIYIGNKLRIVTYQSICILLSVGRDVLQGGLVVFHSHPTQSDHFSTSWSIRLLGR
jgi:hypothetical protein